MPPCCGERYNSIMTDVLCVKNASKSYGSTLALNGANLQLKPGQWLGLLGPNGAGKTTLLRAIVGRVRLDEGEMTLFGTPLNGSTAQAEQARRRLGIVPQDIAVYPMLSARENLRTFGSLNGVEPKLLKQRIDWALDWTELADRSSEPTDRFSGGMKRRLNIACAVLHKPDVLLLDEPTVGVDPQSRQRIWEMLNELRQGGTTILLTTHGLEEAQQVCETIVIIDHGKAIAAGTFHELLQQTIGSQRRVIIHVNHDDHDAESNEKLNIRKDGTIERSIENVSTDLHALLDELAKSGVEVKDLHLESPSLQDVFIHLTGRELRE